MARSSVYNLTRVRMSGHWPPVSMGTFLSPGIAGRSLNT